MSFQNLLVVVGTLEDMFTVYSGYVWKW